MSRFRSAGASIVGRCREINEDAWAADDANGVFVVADGCGGRCSGAAAAEAAVRTIQDRLSQPPSADERHPHFMDPLAAAVHVANERIVHLAVGDHQGMGSALAAIRLDLPWLVIAHVGDCRVYRYRRGYAEHTKGIDPGGGMLHRLTADHDLKLEILRDGGAFADAEEVARTHPNVITRALGFGEHLDIDVQYRHSKPGDLYLLCTDGITRQISDDEVRTIVSDERMSLEDRCQQLVTAADAHGGHDNVTVVLVNVLVA